MADISAGFLKPIVSGRNLSIVLTFIASIFLSAMLLFSVQPMFSKMVLPLLGGAPNVWNTAMVFFQGVLLLGYIYAHLISKHYSPKTQIYIHAAVLLAGSFFLPLTIAQGWTPPEGGAQAFWMIALFAFSVGLPFFALSANAPLLQRWFSQTDDKDAADPYFLYAASNAGSLLSLLLYPVMIEPLLRVQQQTYIWMLGYFLLIAFIVFSGVKMLQNLVEDSAERKKSIDVSQALSLQTRATWIALAFIPSSLMLGVTSYITLNIASAPFLWIVPLALYLLSFIFAFAKKPILTSAQLKIIMPLAVVMAMGFGFFGLKMLMLSIGVSLVSFFIIALAAHSRLAELRPSTEHLTEFYIWMSFGGVLGGIFNALIAPAVFSTTLEYYLVLFASVFIYYAFTSSQQAERNTELKTALAFAIGMSVIGYLVGYKPLLFAFIGALLITYALVKYSNQRLISGLTILPSVLVLFAILLFSNNHEIFRDRSFFGMLRVIAKADAHGVVHKFIHGNSIHNYQLQDEKLKTIPLAYYAVNGTFDHGLRFARTNATDGSKFNVAMIGLGAGAMACYEKASDNWTYFEIDPAVVKMATNPKYFSFMSKCSHESDVRLGDARLKLHNLPDYSQDYIIVDAFSSNSIPAHLVTKEALALYRSKIQPNGLIFFHTSNNSLDVSSVVAAIAKDSGLDSRHLKTGQTKGYAYAKYQHGSTAVMVGSKEQMVALSAFNHNWKKMTPSPDVGIWTDDYSHILGTLMAKLKNNVQIQE